MLKSSKKILRQIIVGAILLLISKLCPAQRSDTAFLESIKISRAQSYFSLTGGIGNTEHLLFEGAIIPYFLLYTDRNKWGIDFSPKIVIRMYNEASCPVRTPSYMPRFTSYYRISDTGDYISKVLFLSWCHHSNGQDGSFYNPDSTINILSGDFSTNMIEAGMSMLLFRPSYRPAPVYLKLSSEYHYRQCYSIHNLYGNFRINGEVKTTFYITSFSKHFQGSKKEQFSIYSLLKMQWIADDFGGISPTDLRRLTISLQFACHPVFLNQGSFYIQFYSGQDYYNIHFNRNISFFRFGILGDLFNSTLP